jgi:hypothetical protein
MKYDLPEKNDLPEQNVSSLDYPKNKFICLAKPLILRANLFWIAETTIFPF